MVLFDTGSDHQAASFTATGSAEETYSLSFPASATLTREGNSETMTVNGFSENATNKLSATGEETFHVGATLNVGANQAPGVYRGEFTVTAAHE
ncbi:MAG: hypothetical protein BWZ06_00931 [Bacteroidetes bacterium ADurb.BinA261]|nr:MAG: hypothetical protein BWZ06_00931 [Bacteroidetes bacterium ADurb.BinA261]